MQFITFQFYVLTFTDSAPGRKRPRDALYAPEMDTVSPWQRAHMHTHGDGDVIRGPDGTGNSRGY